MQETEHEKYAKQTPTFNKLNKLYMDIKVFYEQRLSS